MEKSYRNCQSCGMPLKRDPKGGGANSDGTKSTTYCSYCFDDGKFLQPDWNAKQMQEFAKEKMKGLGFPGFIASFFSSGIPKLERWKSK